MTFTEGTISGTFIINPERIRDKRGFFVRTYCQREFTEHGLEVDFVQRNVSFNSHKGTLRGLHYQVDPHGEIKIVQCISGALYDVVVDLRADSPTYGEWMGVELTAENGCMLYVPVGMAHGYLTLADETELSYSVSSFYTPEAERGLRFDDPAIGIEWPIPITCISEKDQQWPDVSTNGRGRMRRGNT